MGNSGSLREREGQDMDRLFQGSVDAKENAQETLHQLFHHLSAHSSRESAHAAAASSSSSATSSAAAAGRGKRKKNAQGLGDKKAAATAKYTRRDFSHFRHRQKINRVLLDPRHAVNNRLWSCSADGAIVGWDSDSGQCQKLLLGHTHHVTCMVFAAGDSGAHSGDDGSSCYLYSGSYDRTVRCWCVDTGITVREYGMTDNWITCIAVYPEAGLLFSGGFDCTVTVFDLRTTEKLRQLHGHTKRIEHMSLSDAMLYTASADGTVRIWDAESGRVQQVITCRDHCLHVQPMGNFVLCSLYQEIFCHDMSTDEARAPFVCLSSFTVSNHEAIIIAWNRQQQQFEIWDLTWNRIIDTIPFKDIINANNLCLDFDRGILYFSSGVAIYSAEVDVGMFDDTDTSTLTHSTRVHNEAAENSRQVGPIPPYMQYLQLFEYYVHQLLYPSSVIARLIAELHESNTLQECHSHDDQIESLSQALQQREKTIQQREDRKGKQRARISLDERRQIDFEIVVQPTATAVDRRDERLTNAGHRKDSISVYSQEELAMDFETRSQILYDKIRSKESQLQPTVVLVRRENIVLDACKHFSSLKDEDLRKPMFIFFAGEEGFDMGGVTREFYQLLSSSILDPDIALFKRNESNNTYHPNPASTINATHLVYFRFIGKLLGKALFDAQHMDVPFSRVVFKAIVGQPITYDDLQCDDPAMYLSMQNIIHCDDVQVMELPFCADINDFGMDNTVSLAIDGEEISPETSVTEDNKFLFVEAYSRWKMYDSVKEQMRHLIAGVYDVIPRGYLSIFNARELELLLCGQRDVDTAQWKQYTSYEGGFTVECPTVVQFWKLVDEMDRTQRANLLQFVTGTSCLPPEGFRGLHPRFTVCKVRHATGEQLPKSHTCINRIDLMEYAESELLQRHMRIVLDVGLVGFANH